MLLTPKVSKYRVVKGDSLWKIAETQYGNPTVWPGISQANRLPNADLILVGMSLKLPSLRALRYHPHPTPHSHVSQPHYPPIGSRQPHQLTPNSLSLSHSAGSLSSAPVPGTRSTSRVPGPTLSHQTGGQWQLDSHPSKHQGNRSAVSVLFPAVKYKLDDLAPLVVTTPVADFTLRFIGEVTLQQKGTMSEVELSQRGTLSDKLKAEYKSKLVDLAGSVKIGFNSQTRAVQVSCGFSVAAKIDGHVFATSQYDFIPPNRLKYTYKPTPIQGEWQNLVFTGSVGFELEVSVKKPDGPPPLEPLPAPARQRSTEWVWVLAGALVVAGVVIVVADIVKDVGTAGIGAVESPLSFAAASALFSEAAVMVH